MQKISEILIDFSRLSKLQRKRNYVEFQEKLQEAYASGERKLIFNEGTATGLGSLGGVLLGEFLRYHPDMEEITLLSHHFYNPLAPKEVEGMQAFIEGLVETRNAATLRVLDLSNSEYLSEHWVALTETVVRDHPSLSVVKFNGTRLNDDNLARIIPYFSSTSLQELWLRHNRLEGNSLANFTHQCRSQCPQLALLDFTSNNISLGNTQYLKQWLRDNTNLFIRYPQDVEVMQLSLENLYQGYVPSRVSVMMQQFDLLVEKFAELEFRINRLPSVPEDTDARAKIRVLEQRMVVVTQTIEENFVKQNARFDRIDIQLEKQNHHLIHIQTALTEFRSMVTSAQVQLQALEKRLTLDEAEDKTLRDDILHLQQTIAIHQDKISELEEALPLLQELQDRLADFFASPSQATTLAFVGDEAIYAAAFKRALVSMHMTSMIASTGIFQITTTGTTGKAGKIINACSSAIPLGIGIGFKILGYCLQSIDQTITQRRLQHLSELGTMPEDIARLSDQLSQWLVRCRSIENKVQARHMEKLFSSATDMADAISGNGFYGGLVQAIETIIVDPSIDAVFAQGEASVDIQQRAEQDAGVLLAAIAQESVPKKTVAPGGAMNLDIDRLFLYAMPLVTVVNHVYLKILSDFCQLQGCASTSIHINKKKQGKFFGNIAQSWHEQAEEVRESLIDNTRRSVFIDVMASTFSEKEHVDGTKGVFYFKNNLVLMGTHHVSWREHALFPQTAQSVTRSVLHR